MDFFGFNLFFVSRLDDTMENNRLTIQSIGKGVLTNIIKVFCEDYGAIELPILRFYPFQQRFVDECAGVYCSVEIGVPVDWVCEEDDFGDIGEIVPSKDYNTQSKRITVTENGTYTIRPDAGFDGLSRVTVEVDVEGGEAHLYDLTATTNSTYTPAPGFDGFGKVVVDVPTGAEAKLGNLSINEEGEVHRTVNAQDRGLDGFSSVTVNVLCDECDCSSAYTQGYNDGVEDQKDKLTTINVTKNGQYTRGDGYSAITVNVSGDCSSAYTQGYNDAKAELTAVTFNQNGTYVNNSGYSAVTVNVSSGAPEETTVITYKTLLGRDMVPLDSRCKYYDQDGIERVVLSHIFDSSTYTGTITLSGTIAKIDGYMFIPYDEEAPLASNRRNVKSVVLPESITEIGEDVFNGCLNLLDFDFPSNLKSIGRNAFMYTKLKDIDIPTSCVSVGPFAFCNAGNGLTTKLYLRKGTRVLDEAAFKAESTDFGVKEIYFLDKVDFYRRQFPYIYVESDGPTLRTSPYTFAGAPKNGTIHMKSELSNMEIPAEWTMALPSWTFVYDL